MQMHSFSIMAMIGFLLVTLLFQGCSGAKLSTSEHDSKDSNSETTKSFTIGSLAGGSHLGTELLDSNSLKLSFENAHELPLSSIDLSDIRGIWSLNEAITDGTTITDSSGNGLNGQYSSGLGGPRGGDGKLLGAVEMDGIGDYIAIAPSASVNNLTALTASVWVYLHSLENGNTGGDEAFVSKCSSSVPCSQGIDGSGWFFGLSSSGTRRLQFRLNTDSTELLLNTANGYFQLNQWTHFAVTWDGSLTSNQARIYINGVAVAANTERDGTGNISDDSSNDLLIGASKKSPSPEGLIDGLIDEVALWERALNPSEILALYEVQNKGFYGEFESAIFDSNSALSSWQSFSLDTQRPALKPTPLASEFGYSAGNMNITNLVGYWTLDGLEGTAISTAANALTDRGPNSISGTAGDTNSSMLFEGGVRAEGLSFDGTEDFVVLNNSPSLNIIGTEITLMAWVKDSSPYGSLPHSRIISKKQDTLDEDTFSLVIEGSYSADVFFGINGTYHSAADVLRKNTWQHIVAVYNGVDMRIYVDGLERGSPLAFTDTILSSANPVYFGSRQGADLFLNGAMDEVMIFDRALSSTEVSDIYLRTKNKVKYQVRSCDDPICSGENFVGPDGTSASFYSEQLNFDATKSSYPLSHLTNNRYFQFKSIFEESDADNFVLIEAVEIHGRR